jgi:hypothetical protein
MVHVITQFYKVNYKNTDKKLIRKRQDEITRCFKINLNHPHVEKIHFLYEKQEDVDFLKEEGIDKNHEKIVLYNLGSRMHYSLIFDYANQYLKDKICVYLHADMAIHSGFDKLNTENMKKKIYALTAHNLNCNKQFICKCTRQWKTNRGWYGPTYDGFAFKSPIKEKVVEDGNHYVGMLGAENRIICILKENSYDVLCANNILFCYHYHEIKIFSSQRGKWINRAGEHMSQDYYSNIQKQQKNLSWDQKIVGGGIPFFSGSCEFVKEI